MFYVLCILSEQGLHAGHHFTDGVLYAVGPRLRAYALVHDAEAEAVAVGCRGVAGQCAHAVQGARLGLHVAVGRAALHAVFQGAVLTGDGQGGDEVGIDFLMVPDVAQQGYYLVGRGIVVERQSRAVGHVVVVGIQT